VVKIESYLDGLSSLRVGVSGVSLRIVSFRSLHCFSAPLQAELCKSKSNIMPAKLHISVVYVLFIPNKVVIQNL
jgi:hypothetical protein